MLYSGGWVGGTGKGKGEGEVGDWNKVMERWVEEEEARTDNTQVRIHNSSSLMGGEHRNRDRRA